MYSYRYGRSRMYCNERENLSSGLDSRGRNYKQSIEEPDLVIRCLHVDKCALFL